MSELTPCNRCTLRRMERSAEDRGATVIVERVTDDKPMAGWYSARYSDADKPSGYFMAISDGCEC